MTTDEFEPFRGLLLNREQDAEIRVFISRVKRAANQVTLCKKEMLAPEFAADTGEDWLTHPSASQISSDGT